jgi:hypothetical protein
MSMTPTETESRILRILSNFQMLEFTLKLYIAGAYRIIQYSLEGKMPFEYGHKDVENFPLERLLSTFMKLNANKELQRKMNALREKRNLIAHRALIYRHELVRDLLDVDAEDYHADLRNIEIDVDKCLLLMSAELDKVLALQKP